MRRQIFKPTFFSVIRAYLAPLLIMAAVIVLICLGLWQTEASGEREGLNMLKDGLLRASVKCYAIEGKYPESLAYIEENYGIHIDNEKYLVRYEAFASNILPDITVIVRD